MAEAFSSKVEDHPQLHRTIGPAQMALYGLGSMLGAGIYGLIGKAAGQTGNAVWLAFVVAFIAALLVSVLMGYMKLPVVTAVLIFSVALVKAYLVASYYMHLKAEPFFVALILVTGLACLYILFFGLVPDIVFTETK